MQLELFILKLKAKLSPPLERRPYNINGDGRGYDELFK
jgi:hypothetical protein